MNKDLINRFMLSNYDILNYQSMKLIYKKSECDEEFRIICINPLDIIGYTRVDINAKNFDELGDSFHKPYLLAYSDKQLTDIINSNPPRDNYIEVEKIDNQYYFKGEGKHRFILSVILELKSIPVKCYIK